MLGSMSRGLTVVASLFVVMLAPAARADLLYQCQLNQTLWDNYDSCVNFCVDQQWVPNASYPGGGYWNTLWYGCMDVYVTPGSSGGSSGGGGGSSGGGGGGGGGPDWSGPFYQGQCNYDVMCPGANSCLCRGTGNEHQST